MKVDAVHIEPFDFIQIVEFGLCRADAFQLLVDVGNAKFQILCLIWHNPEFRHISVSVLHGVAIAELSWKEIKVELNMCSGCSSSIGV